MTTSSSSSRLAPTPATSTARLLLLLLTVTTFVPALLSDVISGTVSITRHHRGDVFDVSDGKCSMETCIGVSSGTALQVNGGTSIDDSPVPAMMNRGKQPFGVAAGVLTDAGCRCQCIQALPVFRDDLRICVDDLQECSLASFVSGTTVQKIPYVFLPLQGQIVYPSAEIKIAGMQYPICAVSKAKYLTRGGWVNFKNQSDYEIPFQIHRENGHIMLLWLGDLQSRANIEGRLVLIEMICKETLPQDYGNNRAITPCLSFRIAGTPSVKEVLFSADIRTSENTTSSGLTISEVVAVAICSILLGLMYVASILLYLHVRKGRTKRRNGDVEAFKNPLMSNGITEEGLIKNNPLLQHNYNDNEAYESDEDRNFNRSPQGEPTMDMLEKSNNNRNLTTAIVHPVQSFNSCIGHSMYYSDSNSIEKHPEEDISIVETLDNKEEGPDNIRSIVCANPRKKLYFNPDYFEPELLMAPPPAALEFLEKIREVIHEAKRKITMKKYLPNLVAIPEDVNEDADQPLEAGSCDKCKIQFKIKSATIQKWLMDVPTEVAQPEKISTPVETTEVEVAEPIDADAADLRTTLDDHPVESKSDVVCSDAEDEEEEEEEEEESVNIECDSLERSTTSRHNKSGYHTPSEYSTVRRDLSPVLSSSALPMEEELTVKTTYTYDTITKRESHFEHAVSGGPDCVREAPKKETLPDILNNGSQERYSLVSEVYVNDNFITAGASPDGSLDKKIKKDSPGRITIEVQDCPANHPVEDSDSFEPDTLDRHSEKHHRLALLSTTYSSDSLEQSTRPKPAVNAGFGSLLEIYEAKSVMADVLQKRWNATPTVGAKYLQPDPKHCRRQRCPSPVSVPRPPKNACVRSTSSRRGVARSDFARSQCNRRTHHEITAGASDKRAVVKGVPTEQNRYEDSGYLSTESSESFGRAAPRSGLDTDESGSGAESIDTDFKYFRTRTDRNYCDW